jgi:sensor histidine kinase YesM
LATSPGSPSHAGARGPAFEYAAGMAYASQRDFHPLEIIPFFRRFPCTAARNFIYTFIWSTGLGVIFYALAALSDGRLYSLNAFGMYILVSNAIGYAIHGLFRIGDRMGLSDAVRGRGFAAKVVYFSIVPLVGVFLGFAAVTAVTGVRVINWLSHVEAIASIVITSLIISTVLSVIFFWRERTANAEADVARERERRERIERESLAANLRALQAQIEPHFLFNTLANVSSLIDTDRAEAKRMLDSFIRFLRASLAATRGDTTTLGAEAELIAAYLEVLRVRMRSRLRYTIDVPEDLRGFALAPMLLQPVVENAIRHGLEPKVDGGEVRMSARRDADRVAVEIVDSGVGFAPTTRGGVGLSNLRERLRLLYGERASLAVIDAAGGGTAVRMELPA